MAGPDRSAAPDLSAALRPTGRRSFDFFAALRLLECAQPRRAAPRQGGARRSDEPLRLGQEPQLAFATGEPRRRSSRGRRRRAGQAGGAAVRPVRQRRPAAAAPDRRMRWTAARQAGDDDVHRLLRPAPAPADRAVLPRLGRRPAARPARSARSRTASASMSARSPGFGLPALRDARRPAGPLQAAPCRPARLPERPCRSASRCWCAISLACPRALEEFVGGWLDLPSDCAAGSAAPARAWGRRGGRRSPASSASTASASGSGRSTSRPISALLPGGARLERLTALMRMLVGRRDRVGPGLVLQAARGAGAPPRRRRARLGWTSWLPARDALPTSRRSGADGRCGRRPERGTAMLGIRREAVYTKLEPIPFRALESAFQLARTRGDAYVELAHWLNQICMQPDSDLHRIVSRVRHRPRPARRRHEPDARADPQGRLGDARLLRAHRPGDRARLDRRQPGVRRGSASAPAT